MPYPVSGQHITSIFFWHVPLLCRLDMMHSGILTHNVYVINLKWQQRELCLLSALTKFSNRFAIKTSVRRCLVCFSVDVITLTKSSLVDERVYSILNFQETLLLYPSLTWLRPETQNRTQEVGIRNWITDHVVTLLTNFLPKACSATLLTEFRPTYVWWLSFPFCIVRR